jgi:beta-phosphoglucomutase-like phosphatase (HAD superfamily)
VSTQRPSSTPTASHRAGSPTPGGAGRPTATSSSRRTVERHLTAHDLTERFHVIVGHGDYEAGKPAPDPFLKAAERLGVEPRLCLALEDSHNGIRSASSAGMMTIMIPDLLEPTDEIRGLCALIAADLHEVRRLIVATAQRDISAPKL